MNHAKRRAAKQRAQDQVTPRPPVGSSVPVPEPGGVEDLTPEALAAKPEPRFGDRYLTSILSEALIHPDALASARFLYAKALDDFCQIVEGILPMDGPNTLRVRDEYRRSRQSIQNMGTEPVTLVCLGKEFVLEPEPRPEPDPEHKHTKST
jgi:hypothetical protein